MRDRRPPLPRGSQPSGHNPQRYKTPHSSIQSIHRLKSKLADVEQRLTLIARVTSAPVGSAPLAEQVRDLVQQVCSAFGVDACVARSLEGEDLQLIAATGVPTESLALRLPVDWGISREILTYRRPMAISDVRFHVATSPVLNKLPNSYQFLSYAGAPLMVEDRVLGILGIYSRRQIRHFTLADLEHLRIVANHIAVSIVNDRLYKEVQSQKEEIERQLAERRRLEDQLLQARKMESIGRLAGGIAHDFNNLLTAILGYGELAEEELEEEHPALNHVIQARQAALRASDLTRQLLAFARKQRIQPRPIDLNLLVSGIRSLLRPLVNETIELVVQVESAPLAVIVDPTQMEQVLVNLAVNARDAMPEGGRLTLAVDRVPMIDYPELEVEPGPYAHIQVTDTGHGMTEAVRSRLFEPYFTTKELGKGTGLGLATCYGIVKQSRGYLFVETEPEKGTTFHIYLPCVETAVIVGAAPATAPSSGGSETILLVEDDALVRGIAIRTLLSQGYKVLEAVNGREAIRVIQSYPGEISLLLTDVVMPEMGGRELAVWLRERRPSIRVMFTSGYTQGLLPEADEKLLLPKPFMPADLTRKVREILDAAPPGPKPEMRV